MTVLGRLPWPVMRFMADILALIVGDVLRYRRAIVDENLQRCFPETTSIERKALRRAFYRSLADTMFETLKSFAMDAHQLSEHVEISNANVLDIYVSEQQPVMIIGSHQANWEWIFLACSSSMSLPVEGVYQPLHNKWFDRQLGQLRTSFGARLIPDRDALQDVIRHLKVPRIVTMVSDQHPPRKAPRYWATFLNRDTAFYTGWAKLAQATRYPVFYAHRERTSRGRYRVTLELLSEPPHSGNVDSIVENYVRALEKSIRQQPETWLWSHRRWRDEKPLYQ